MPESLKSPSAELKKEAALWLDFEEMTGEGTFFSYGIGARTYGAIWPDRRPQPEMWQIKKSAQPVKVRLISAEKKEIEVLNRYLFTNLNELQCLWMLQADNEIVDKGEILIDLAPQKSRVVAIPFRKPETREGVEYRMLISFRQKGKTLWADSGFEVAWDQLDLPWFIPVQEKIKPGLLSVAAINENNNLIVTGKDFRYTFDRKTGTLSSLQVSGKELIKQGAELNVWRAPLANETDEWAYSSSNTRHRTAGFGRFAASEWYSAGLDKMQKELDDFNYEIIDNQNIVVNVKSIIVLGTKRGAFFNHFRYQINGTGEITIDHSVIPNGDMPSWLPRVGVEWILDKTLDNVEWYGRGPQENYPDRKTGYKTGVYKLTVKEMYEPYLIPQDYGLRTDNRWVRMTGKDGIGLEFSGNKLFNFSAQP
jgi:Beta-galactosidase/beta-glucuronidase